MALSEKDSLQIIKQHYRSLMGNYRSESLNQAFSKILADREVFSIRAYESSALSETDLKERFNRYLQEAEPRE